MEAAVKGQSSIRGDHDIVIVYSGGSHKVSYLYHRRCLCLHSILAVVVVLIVDQCAVRLHLLQPTTFSVCTQYVMRK